jgi:magnesium transporter
MARFFKHRSFKLGKSPDTLFFMGNQKMEHPRIRVIDFDKSNLKEDELTNIKEGVDYINTNTVTWINIDGLHDMELIQEVGSAFTLHPLLLEDLINTSQRPKLEDFDNCLFITLKMMHYNQEQNVVKSDQFSMIIGATYLLTFQEKPGNWFEPIRKRIRKPKSRIRTFGTDYLAFALIRSIIEHYNQIIGKIGDSIEDLEDEILSNPDSSVMGKINDYKRK